MRDMLFELTKAKKQKIFMDNEFIDLLFELKSVDSANKLNWDDGAGEEWAFINNPNLSIMINRRIGICFIRGKLNSAYKQILNHCNCVCVNDFSIKEWYLDIEELHKNIPEIIWNISNDGIMPNEFSLDELYFETV